MSPQERESRETFSPTEHLGTVKDTLKNAVHHLASTFKHLKYPYQLLLIPFTLWSGLEQTYISAQFTKVSRLDTVHALASLVPGLHYVCRRCEIRRPDHDRVRRVRRIEQSLVRTHSEVHRSRVLSDLRCLDQLCVDHHDDRLGAARESNLGAIRSRWLVGSRRRLLANSE